MIEPNVCNDCGRNFLSENKDDLLCAICNEDTLSFKEALLESEEIKEYIEEQYKHREKWMKVMLKKKLKWYDKPLFYFYKKLADYFGGGKRVVTLQQRDGLNQTQFGIEIYGKKYWLIEKEVHDIAKVPD